MPNNETTTKFKVDISELTKAMQEAKRSIAVANSEFKEAASSCDDWSKSSDGLNAKLTQLDKTHKAQKTILKSLEAQYDALTDEQKQGSKAADDLRIKINNQKAAINKTEREISNFEGALDEVSEAEKKAAKTGKSVSDVLEEMGEEAKGAEGGFTVLKGAVATFAGNVMTGFADSIRNGISNLVGLAEETREFRNNMSKIDAAAEAGGYSADYASAKYEHFYGVLGDDTASATTVNNLMATGASMEDLNKITSAMTGIWAKYGDSIPLDGLAESINETAKVGQITGNLADALNWAGISEDKFNEKLEKCNSEQERQSLIADTLKGAYDSLGESYMENNESIIDANQATLNYQKALAGFGEKVEPITTAVREGFTGILNKLLELVEGVDISVFTTAISEAFAVLTDTVIPAIVDGFGWIIDNKDILIAGLAGIAAGFVAFKVASLIMSVVNAFKAFKIANEGATVAQWLLNTAMLANPIPLVVAAIVGLVAAFVVLWKKSESFRNFWINIWNKIKSVCANAVSAIGTFFTKTVPQALDKMITFFAQLPSKIWTWLLNVINKVSTWASNLAAKAKAAASGFVNKVVEWFKQLPSKVWTWLVNVVSKVLQWRANMISKAKEAASGFINSVISYIKQLPSKIWTWLSNAASKVGSWGSSLVSKGKEAAGKMVSAVVSKVKEIPSKMLSIGKDIISGLWDGIGDRVSWLKKKISGFVGDVTGWLKKFFKIGSPSKLMAEEVGRWLPEGIAVGIDKNAKSVLSSMRDLSASTVSAARSGLSGSGSINRGGVVNNFTQVINSPKQLSRLDIYRQSKNLLGYAGGGA